MEWRGSKLNSLLNQLRFDQIPNIENRQPFTSFNNSTMEKNPLEVARLPEAKEILQRCREAGEKLWFPSTYTQEVGKDRYSIEDTLWQMRQSGLIEVKDWVKGQGQGYGLTPIGVALADNKPIPKDLHEDHSEAESEEGEVQPKLRVTAPEQDRSVWNRGETARQILSNSKPIIAVPIIAVIVVVWFLVGLVVAWRTDAGIQTYLTEGSAQVLNKIGAVSGFAIEQGQWWKLLSSVFVHVGLLHLFCNLFVLAAIGPVAELALGRIKFLYLYILCGLAGSAFAIAIQPNVILAGASGANWGMMVALLVWLLLNKRHLPNGMVADMSRRLMIVLLLNAGVSFLPGISWQAHLGGAVCGALATWLFETASWSREQFYRSSAWAGLVLIPLALVAGLVVAKKNLDVWQELRPRVVAGLNEGQKDQPKSQAADPSGVDPAVRAAIEREILTDWNLVMALTPDKVEEVLKAVNISSVVRTEKMAKEAQEKAEQLVELVEKAQKRFVKGTTPARDQMNDYLVEVQELAEKLQALGKAKEPPKAEDWNDLIENRAKLRELWDKLTAP